MGQPCYVEYLDHHNPPMIYGTIDGQGKLIGPFPSIEEAARDIANHRESGVDDPKRVMRELEENCGTYTNGSDDWIILTREDIVVRKSDLEDMLKMMETA